MNRQLTSRRLINDGERATDAVYLKNFMSNGFGAASGFFNYDDIQRVYSHQILNDNNWWKYDYVVDGETDCQAVQAKLALSSPVLLHQCHDDRALVVVVVVVGILESDSILRIQVKSGWEIE